eukprot:14922787-Alexandrium_andersonii.AAC.1
MKHRISWDLRRSLVNSLVRQGERIVLRRLSGVAADAVKLLREFGTDLVSFFGADVPDAFHQVPLSPDEYQFTVMYIDGVYDYFTVRVFG